MTPGVSFTPTGGGMSAFEVVGQEVLIPLEQIDDSGRLRPLDAAWVEALARMFEREGQKTAVEVYAQQGDKPFKLGPGGHRVAAAKLLGWTQVKAIVREGDQLERRHAEVSENLFRKDLNPIDRAAFVAELVSIERARSGISENASAQQIAADARWAKQLKTEAEDASVTVTRAYGFADNVAAGLGFSRETVYRDLLLHRCLRAEVADQLRGTPIAGNAGQLRALAKLPEAEQRRAAKLISEGKVKSVGEAIATIQHKPKPKPEDKRLSAFVGAFSRMSAREKRAALSQLADMLPKGVTLDVGGHD